MALSARESRQPPGGLPALTPPQQRPANPPKRVARINKPLTAREHSERLRGTAGAPAAPPAPSVPSLQLQPRPGCALEPRDTHR